MNKLFDFFGKIIEVLLILYLVIISIVAAFLIVLFAVTYYIFTEVHNLIRCLLKKR